MFTKMRRRRIGALLAMAVLVATGACNDFLTVSNPGAIEAPDIDNPAYAGLLVNGVIGEFQPAFTSTALYSGVFTDELANFHGFGENITIDVRDIAITNGTYAISVYTPVQSARFMADTTAVLLRHFFGANAEKDVRLARVLAYGGYSYTLLGEQMCEAPIGVSRAYTSDELLAFALDKFKDAIAVATAARTANSNITPTSATAKRDSAAADSLLTLARVGAARVSLDLGNKTDAITYATGVPSAFAFLVYHATPNARENNPFFSAASGGPNAEWVGITNTPFATVTNDPRLPHPVAKEKMQQDSAVVPNSPQLFTTYNGTAVGADFTRDAGVKFASGLEAQYILAEAQGNTAANVTFVNSRRAIGGLVPLVNPTNTEYDNALRQQRALDLYLGNYRMGDLRRYKARYQVDLWQRGPYTSPVPASATFGPQECWPIPLAEYNGNPNLPRP